MISFKDENIYDMALISKVKKQTGPKKIKNILKNLRNIAIEDVKEFSELKVKVLKEEKKPEIKIAAPIFGFQRFFEDFKNLNSKEIINMMRHTKEKILLLLSMIMKKKNKLTVQILVMMNKSENKIIDFL